MTFLGKFCCITLLNGLSNDALFSGWESYMKTMTTWMLNNSTSFWEFVKMILTESAFLLLIPMRRVSTLMCLVSKRFIIQFLPLHPFKPFFILYISSIYRSGRKTPCPVPSLGRITPQQLTSPSRSPIPSMCSTSRATRTRSTRELTSLMMLRRSSKIPI